MPPITYKKCRDKELRMTCQVMVQGMKACELEALIYIFFLQI